MTLKRTSNNNYSDFTYTSEVKKLLDVTLNKRDENKLKKIYTNFYKKSMFFVVFLEVF